MPDSPEARSIFISYRRDDAGGEAGRLFDDLTRAFNPNTVFMDVAGIEPGKDFRQVIDANVAAAGVLLAVIGPQWLTIADANGNQRLKDPNDFVRLEVASALARNIPVIPVLVHAATMPHADQLPDDLKDLAYRNAVELTLARWNSDVALLVTALTSYVHVTPANAAKTVHASLPVQLPAPDSPDTDRSPKSNTGLYAGIAGGALAVIAVIAFIATRSMTPMATPPAPAPTTQFQVPLPFNATGIYPDGATFPQTSGVDSAGNAFHPFNNHIAPGTQTMTVNDGTVFTIGPTAANDFVIPSQQAVALPAQAFQGMVILGASVGGPAPAQDFTIDYKTRNGHHTPGMSDWTHHQQLFPFETIAVTQNYVNTYAGTRQPGEYLLYEYHLKLDPTQQLERIILPNNPKLAIFAITLKP